MLSIRSKKFPDWNIIGTAGSFFKNPVIDERTYITLAGKYPEIPGYNIGFGKVKIALGWVLDHVCNLKGFRTGDIGLFEKQALVLVCTKGISAREVEIFSEKIISVVQEKINITVEREVSILK